MEHATNQDAPPMQRETDEEIDTEFPCVTVCDISREQAYLVLDRQARRYFGVSADEFVRAYRAGEFADHPEQTNVTYVAMLIPMVE